jgi:hypothetical protein
MGQMVQLCWLSILNGLTEVSLTEPVAEKFPPGFMEHSLERGKKRSIIIIRSCIKHWQEFPQCEKGFKRSDSTLAV